MKHTKKALLMSCLSLLLCMSMLVGTTFAWFTDTASTGVNTIVAGNLDVKLEYSYKMNDWNDAETAADNAIFGTSDLWEPGFTKVIYFQVKNVGSLALNYQIGTNLVENILGLTADDATIDLTKFIKFAIVPTDKALTREEVRAAADASHSFGDLSAATELLAGEADTFAFVAYMPESVGNEANHGTGKTAPSIKFGIRVLATQATEEKDSFDDQYDKDAANPPASVSTEQDLLNAIQDGKDVVLTANIELTNAVSIAAGQALTIDLNGNNLTFATDGATAIENRGTLTIEDAEGTGSITARIGVSNYGTLILNSGTIVADEQGGAAIYNNAGSDANFTMNGGTLKATFVGSYADGTGGACIRNTGDSVTTITGGTLESRSARTYAIISNGTLNITPAAGSDVTMTAYRGIAVDAGTATINGGTFTVLDANAEEGTYVAYETYYALYVGGNDSVVIVNGGTFTAPDSSVWRPDWDEAATDLVINGGTFNGSLIGNAGYYPSKYIAVKGGTFDEDPTAYLATGYKASDNGDGTYSVVAEN